MSSRRFDFAHRFWAESKGTQGGPAGEVAFFIILVGKVNCLFSPCALYRLPMLRYVVANYVS